MKVTVSQFAKKIGIPVDKLLEQLVQAGVPKQSGDDPIEAEEKRALLNYLRINHGKQILEDHQADKAVTVKRKKVLELKQKTPVNRSRRRSTERAVNVQVRHKKTYKAPKKKSREALLKEAEAAKKALQEQAEQRRKIEEQERARREAQARMQQQNQAQKEAKERRLKQEEEKKRQAEIAQKQAEQEIKRQAELAAQNQAEETAQEQKETISQTQAEEAVQKQTDKKEEERKKAEQERKQREKDLELVRRAAEQRKAREKAKKQRKKNKEKTEGRKKKKGSAQPDEIKKSEFQKPVKPVIKKIDVPESITVGELAQKMAVKSAEVIKTLMQMGMMVTINQSLDQDTACLVVEEMGHQAVPYKEKGIEEKIAENLANIADADLKPRAPVVTIMGHVDHGKTSLLDYIRRSNITKNEAGGITQHIGAYQVKTKHGLITFLDTPGHRAFSNMRARGAQVTDIVVLVVAADDGVMPQTKEAIQHAQAAEVPLIVAINKIDKPDAQPERVIQELVNEGIVPDSWGGDHLFVEISAKTGQGVDELLESILLQADILELKAPFSGPARGAIIESSLEKGRGAVATVLIQSGQLKQGDAILAGEEYGRVRALFNEQGKKVHSATPAMPVQVLGLSGAPQAGEELIVLANEKKARELAEERREKNKSSRLAEQKAAQLDQMFANMGQDQIAYVNLIIKADVQGSLEALKETLQKIEADEAKVRIIAASIGGITESDVNLALTSEAAIIAFNVRAERSARKAIEEHGIDVRYYSIIYEVIDDIKKAVLGLLTPEIREEIVGLAEVRDVFKSSKFGTVAGCIVLDGVVKRHNPIRVLRNNVVIYEGELESLRRYKDDVNEVRAGTECGIGVKNYNDVKIGDQIEVFERKEVQKQLKEVE